MIKLKDIAQLTGVHVSTVSKALHGGNDVSIEKREEVLRVAHKLGYRLPGQRRTRKLGDAITVAVIYPDIASTYYSRLLVSIEEKISRYNGFMISACSHFSSENETLLIERFVNMPNLDGLILITDSQNLTESLSKIEQLMPIVVISHGDIANKVDLIKVNDRDAIDDAIAQLIFQGHSEIGYIGETLTYHRLNSFRISMEKHGLPVNENHIKVSTSRFEEAGYIEMNKMIKQGDLPTAIYVAYDNIAFGAMRAIYEAGMKIPRDISIIGQDATKTADYLKDKLTTIDCHIEEQGNIACSILYKKIVDPNFTVMQNVVIGTELIMGETIAPPQVLQKI